MFRDQLFEVGNWGWKLLQSFQTLASLSIYRFKKKNKTQLRVIAI